MTKPITKSVVWELKADITFLDTETSVIGEPDIDDYKVLFGTFDTKQDALTALKRFNPNEHDFNYECFIDTIRVYIEPKIVCSVEERVLTHITDKSDSYLPTLKREVDELKYDTSTLKRILSNATITMSDSRKVAIQKRLNTKLKHLKHLDLKLNQIQTLSNTKDYEDDDLYVEL